MLDFAAETDRERAELYRELLTFDYYLRENAKSRPAFARDLTPYYRRIREFYEKEEEAPGYLEGYSGYHARQLMKMTHLEPFFYPVGEMAEGGAGGRPRRGEPCFVLFDYERRDPLSRNAAMFVTEE